MKEFLVCQIHWSLALQQLMQLVSLGWLLLWLPHACHELHDRGQLSQAPLSRAYHQTETPLHLQAATRGAFQTCLHQTLTRALTCLLTPP